MATTSWLLYLHRYAFSFLKPILSREWQLSNEELGQIDSAFGLAYALGQFPLALLADGLGAHVMLPVLMVVWLAGLGVMARSRSAADMWYGQVLLATGQSAVYACLNRVGRMWYPPQVRTTLQGIVAVFAGRLGGLSASILFAAVLLGELGLPWPTALGWLIAGGIVLLILIVVFLSDSPRRHPLVNAAEANLIEGGEPMPDGADRSRHSIMRMLAGCSPRSLRNLGFVTLSSLLSTAADSVFSGWIPQFLSQVHDLKFSQMGLYSALPLLGGAIAGPVGGALNDWLAARTGNRRWARAGVAIAGKGIAALLLLLALLAYRQPYFFCICLFFVKFFSDWGLASLWGVIADIGGRTTASVFAFNNSIAAAGLVISPLIYGMVADRYGWPAVFVTAAGILALCAATWLAIDSTIPVMAAPADERERQ
jgi:ACS family glucarate transporter-like MFS transporter